jgi:hypothetical protein
MSDNYSIIQPIIHTVSATQITNTVIVSSPGPQGPIGVVDYGTLPVTYPITNASGTIGLSASYIPASATYSSSANYSLISASSTYSASSNVSASSIYATNAGSANYSTNSGNSSTTSQTNFNTLTLSGSTVATQAYVLSNIPASAQYAGSAIYSTNSGSANYATVSASSTNASSAQYSLNSTSATISSSAITSTSAVFAGSANYAISAGSATTSTSATYSAWLDGYPASSYALLSSPSFTGTPLAPTAASNVSNTQIATTAYVNNAVTQQASLSASTGYLGYFYQTDNVTLTQNTASAVPWNGNGVQNGFSYNGSSVTFVYPGYYTINYNIQVNGGGNGHAVNAWYRKNGVDIPNTNYEITLSSQAPAQLIQGVYTGYFSAGDILQVMVLLTGGTGTYLWGQASAVGPPAQPATPAAVLNIELVTYVQSASTVTYAYDSASLGGIISSSYALNSYVNTQNNNYYSSAQAYANTASLNAYNAASAYTQSGSWNNANASVRYSTNSGSSNYSTISASSTTSSSAVISSSAKSSSSATVSSSALYLPVSGLSASTITIGSTSIGVGNTSASLSGLSSISASSASISGKINAASVSATQVVGGGMDLIYSSTFSSTSGSIFDDIFSSSYNNYKVIINFTGTLSGNLSIRLRSNGTAETTLYTGVGWSGLTTAGTAVTTTSASSWSLNASTSFSSTPTTLRMEFFNPFLSVSTHFSNQMWLTNPGVQGAMYFEGANTNSASYIGFTLINSASTLTAGSIRVYGYHN